MKIDDQTFERIFSENYKKFVRFADYYVHDHQTAEDWVSDAIVYYWENRRRLPDDTNVPAYIVTVIKNNCLDHLRHLQIREKVHNELLTDAQWELNMRITTLTALDPTEVYSAEVLERINQTLSKLPEKTQQIFRQSRFDNMSNKEIAADHGLSIKTIESHITSALKALRNEFNDYFPLLLFLLF